MIAGGCLCGAVRYQSDAEPFGAAVCHCTICRRAHGAPMVAWFSLPEGDLRLTGDLGEVRTSEHAVRRFCRACGTHLLFDDVRYPGEIDLAASTLDDPAVIRPRFHIWTRSQLPWVKLDDGLPAYPESSGP